MVGVSVGLDSLGRGTFANRRADRWDRDGHPPHVPEQSPRLAWECPGPNCSATSRYWCRLSLVPRHTVDLYLAAQRPELRARRHRPGLLHVGASCRAGKGRHSVDPQGPALCGTGPRLQPTADVSLRLAADGVSHRYSPTTSESMNIIKNSSVAFAVSISELTMFAMQAQEETSRGVEIYLAVTALYFVSAFAVNRVAISIEDKVRVPGMIGGAK